MGRAEKPIEDYLVKRCDEENILQYKFTAPGVRGVPDRILIHKGNVIFVECKAPKQKPREDQKLQIQKLHEQNVFATYVDTKSQIDILINDLKNFPKNTLWVEKIHKERTRDEVKNNRIFKAKMRTM